MRSSTLRGRPFQGTRSCTRLRLVPVAASAVAPPQLLLDDAGRAPLLPDTQLPLLHKRVLVTAPRQYAQKLCAKLTAAGARTLWVPGVKITQLTDVEALQKLDASLAPLLGGQGQGPPYYTHIAFTSKNGIHSVVQRLSELTGGLEAAVSALQRSNVQLCALGADGDVLRQLGLPVHVAPPEASTLGLVRHLSETGAAAGAVVLCPVPLVTGGLVEPPVVPRFLAALQQAGATPVRVDSYVTTPGATAEQCAAEAQQLQQGHVHAVAFSSTAEAQGLLQCIGGREAFQAAVLKHGIVLSAHGPYTAAGASQVLDLPVSCVSRNFTTFDGLVTALEAAFALQAIAGKQAVAAA